jgi:PAS domain S-box-containing protein
VLAIQLRGAHGDVSVPLAVAGVALAWAFAAAAIVALVRRPENGTCRLLLAVCFAWLLGQLSASRDAAVYTIGEASGALVLAATAHLVLAYPAGVLRTRLDRVVVACGYALAICSNVVLLMLDPHPDCATCPTNVILVHRSRTAADAVNLVVNVAAVVLLGIVVAVVARRYRASTTVARRTIRPIGIAGGAALLLILIGFAASPFSDRVSRAFTVAALLLLITVPFWFVVGLLRSRLARGGVAQLLLDVRETATLEATEDALRRALNDPGVRLAAWVAERRGYVDRDGRTFELPEADVDRVTTAVSDDDGTPLAAIVHDRTLLDEPELVDGVAAAVRFALQRNRLQAELRARLDELQRERDFMRDVVNAAPAFFLVMDYDGRITRFNDRMATACGVVDDDTVRGRYWWDVFLVPEDAPAASTLTKAAATREQQHRFRAADGGELVVAWSLTPVSDSRGTPLLVLTGADVSDRVLKEAELRRERDFLRTVARATATLMCVVDADGVVTDRGVNPAFTAATGVTDAGAVGRPFWELVVAPDEIDRVRSAFADAVLWGAVDRFETRWHAAGGGELTVEWWVTPLAAAGSFLVAANDVTKRKRDENELRQSRARLLEAADAERRRLERNLHDGAQQRLVSLSLALRLVEQMLERDPHTAAEVLGAAAEELALALQELRELARGLHPAVLTDRGLAAALEALAERAPLPVEVEVELAERLPEPVEVAIYYVVSEALANVSKYAGASAAAVRVGCAAGMVAVEVSDDGAGGADPGGGSGLRGLVDRVEALEGRLRVDSPPGQGTRVLATIPVRELQTSEVWLAVPQDAG